MSSGPRSECFPIPVLSQPQAEIIKKSHCIFHSCQNLVGCFFLTRPHSHFKSILNNWQRERDWNAPVARNSPVCFTASRKIGSLWLCHWMKWRVEPSVGLQNGKREAWIFQFNAERKLERVLSRPVYFSFIICQTDHHFGPLKCCQQEHFICFKNGKWEYLRHHDKSFRVPFRKHFNVMGFFKFSKWLKQLKRVWWWSKIDGLLFYIL